MERPRLLIFDFDGVLADTEDLHFDAFAAALRSVGVELRRDSYYQRYLGLNDQGAMAAALADHGRQLDDGEMRQLLARKRAEYAERAPQAQLYRGAAEVVRGLAPRHLLAIASGAFRDEITGVLDRGGVRDLFRAVVSAEDAARGKPAPDPFLRALEAVNRANDERLLAAQCLVIEDAPHGIEAARAAGMRCIAVTTSHRPDQLSAADAVIGAIGELGGVEGLA